MSVNGLTPTTLVDLRVGIHMSDVLEFLVLGHAGFPTMFSFTVLRVVVMK